MRVLTIVGPTYTRTDGGLDNLTTLPSIDDRLNAKIAELEAQGATNITVDIKPISTEWHAGYITYGGRLAHTEAESYDVQYVADGIGVSRSTIQERVRRGEISAFRVGRRIKIPGWEYSRLKATTS